MNALIAGGGHDVVALHGWFGSSRGWGQDFPSLLEEMPGVSSVTWVDYRGHGDRRGETGAYTLDEIADDVLALVAERGLGQVTLLGHSMGGAAALRIASRAPEQVRALVGVSPVGATPTPFDEPSRALFEGAAADDAKRAAIIDLTTGHQHSATWVQGLVAASREQSTQEAFAGHLQAWAHADFAAEVPGELPALVVVGAHDPALGEPTVRQTWLGMLPGAELVVLPASGHYPMNEQPVALADALERFLAEH